MATHHKQGLGSTWEALASGTTSTSTTVRTTFSCNEVTVCLLFKNMFCVWGNYNPNTFLFTVFSNFFSFRKSLSKDHGPQWHPVIGKWWNRVTKACLWHKICEHVHYWSVKCVHCFLTLQISALYLKIEKTWTVSFSSLNYCLITNW